VNLSALPRPQRWPIWLPLMQTDQMGVHMQVRSEEFRDNAAECEEIAKQYRGLIKEQCEQLAGQWSFLTARTLIVRDPVLLCAVRR
jgi:hypothetical protein